MKQMLHRIDEAAAVLGVGRSTIYGLVGRGELQTVHIGRRALVTSESLNAYVERLTSESIGHDGAA